MESFKLKIRQARQEDIDEIEELYKQRVLFNDGHGIHQWDLTDVTWKELSKLYDIQNCYVGIYENHIVSAMMVVDIDQLYWPQCAKKESLYLHKLCVHPLYRGKSFADLMIAYFIELGKLEGYPSVRLDVREHKKKLREMYERHNFHLVCIIQVHKEFKTALYECK